MIRYYGALAALILTAGCSLPFFPAAQQPSGLRLQFTPPASRTVVPDLGSWLSQIDELALTLTRTDAAAPDLSFTRTGPGVATSAQSFTGVPVGTWTVSVVVKKAATTVGTGQTTGVVVSASATTTISINLAPSLSTGAGNLSLAVGFPDAAGVTGVSAELTRRADSSAASVSVGPLTAVSASDPPRSQVSLSALSLAAGAYDLDVTLTEPTGTRTYRQAVNIYDGLTADQTVAPDGTLTPGWYLSNEFFGSSTFLAGVTFSFPEGNFSSPTRDYTFFTNEPDFHLSADPAYSGQTAEYWDEGQWTALPPGQNTPDWTVPKVVTLRVTAPGGARGYYTLAVSGVGSVELTGLAQEPAIEFTTPVTGQQTWAFDETVSLSATSNTGGTWAWLFDGQIVAGQTTSEFSAQANSLSTVPGAHVVTALFTARGATWARQSTVFFTEVFGDVRLSVQARKTEVRVSGATVIVYEDSGLTVSVDDLDLDKLVYGIDNLENPTSLTPQLGVATVFFASTENLEYGLHTLYLQVQFHDGRLAAAMVPFQVKPRGAVAGLFELSAPSRFHPLVSNTDFDEAFQSLQTLGSATPLELGVTIPSLPLGYASDATLLRATFNGEVKSYTSLGTTVVVGFTKTGLTPGVYALTLELWGGPSVAERRSLGSQTILIYANTGVVAQ